MKAVLVIDIPEDHTGSVISVNLYGGNNKLIHETYVNELRLLPQKMTWGHTSEYIHGYNACLEEIAGDEE